MTQFVKKDRTLFLTGAVLFALGRRGHPLPEAFHDPLALLALGLLVALGVGSWMRRFALAWGAALALALIQAGPLLWGAFQGGRATPDAVLPALLWGFVLFANSRKERREVYFSRDA